MRSWRGELRQVLIWIIGALAVLGTIYYFFVHRFTRLQHQKS